MKIKEISIDKLIGLLPDHLVKPSDALLVSVRNHGVLVPPVVCNGIVCDGHRRLAACRALSISETACLETSGSAGLLFAEMNSHRELNAYEAAAVFIRLSTAEQKAFLVQTGISESPQMQKALEFIASQVLAVPEFLEHSMPFSVWRELGHLGNAIADLAIPLLILPGTVAEKRNIAGLLRQAQRRNELPETLPGKTAAEVLENLQKIAQPRRSDALTRYESALKDANFPPGSQVRIDPTFSQPGLHLSINLTRNHLDRFDQAKKAVEMLFQSVPEL